jgi:hypothetical protein
VETHAEKLGPFVRKLWRTFVLYAKRSVNTRLANEQWQKNPPVCLNGSLDEFSIQDILQILSMSRKTGHLSLETPTKNAAIVIQEGFIVASVDAGGFFLAVDLALSAGQSREEVIHWRIAASLTRLSRYRQGGFRFQASAQPPRVIGGFDMAAETLRSGIGVIEMLLEVALRQDEEARDAAPAPRTPPETARPAEPLARPGAELSILLVDDEELVRLPHGTSSQEARVVEAKRCRIGREAGSQPERGGRRFVVVTDLNMPASAGDSFRGGREVVKRLASCAFGPCRDDGRLRERVDEGRAGRGVWSVVLKLGLSKLDPEEFEADMRVLAGRMVQDVLPRVCSALFFSDDALLLPLAVIFWSASRRSWTES